MITLKQFTQYLCSDNKYSLKDSMDVDRVLFLILKFVLKKTMIRSIIIWITLFCYILKRKSFATLTKMLFPSFRAKNFTL